MANKNKHAFESNKEQLLPFNDFVFRFGRYFLFASLLITFSIGIGVLGYHVLGGLNYIDSFHMTSMILTGMGPVAEMKSDNAKLFSSFYALYSGIAFLTVSAIVFAPVVHRLLHALQVEK